MPPIAARAHLRTRSTSVLGAIVGILWVGCSSPEPSARAVIAEPAVTHVPEPPPTVAWVGGDVLMSGAIRRSIRPDSAAGFARIIAPVSARWRSDDGAFVMVNMEAPVAERRNENDLYTRDKAGPGRVPAPLNAPRWMLQGLQGAGVDAIMLANNHALDQEREGLRETIQSARRLGLVTTGAGVSPHVAWPIVVGEEGRRLAILSYFDKENPEPPLEAGDPGLNILGPNADDQIRVARQDADAVLVVIHVVAELFTGIKPRWRETVRALVASGADAIAIHGQHVVAPVEVIEGPYGPVTVAYGLGNFFSDMGAATNPDRRPTSNSKWEDVNARSGLLMRVALHNGEIDVRFLPLWMHHNRWLVHNRAHDELTFSLVPLAPEGSPFRWTAPRWEEPWAGAYERWLGEERDRLARRAGLVAEGPFFRAAPASNVSQEPEAPP
ncbi:MAG: CapA family protein [Myxococcota bacterium]